MNKSKVTFYMLLTIIGGAVFVGSQAWEWKNFIKGEYGALETKEVKFYNLLIQTLAKELQSQILLSQFQPNEVLINLAMVSGTKMKVLYPLTPSRSIGRF